MEVRSITLIVCSLYLRLIISNSPTEKITVGVMYRSVLDFVVNLPLHSYLDATAAIRAATLQLSMKIVDS